MHSVPLMEHVHATVTAAPVTQTASYVAAPQYVQAPVTQVASYVAAPAQVTRIVKDHQLAHLACVISSH